MGNSSSSPLTSPAYASDQSKVFDKIIDDNNDKYQHKKVNQPVKGSPKVTSSSSSNCLSAQSQLLYSSDDEHEHSHAQKRVNQKAKSTDPNIKVSSSSSHSTTRTRLLYTSDDDDDDFNKDKFIRLPVHSSSSSTGITSSITHSTGSTHYNIPTEENFTSLSSLSSDESDTSLTTIRNHSINSPALHIFDSKCEEEADGRCSTTTVANKKTKKQKSGSEDDEDYELEEIVDDDTDIDGKINEAYDYSKLVDMSVFSQLQSYLIGIKEMKTNAIKTLYGRVSSFVGFVMSECNRKDNANRIYTQEEAIEILLEGDINIIERYVQVLKMDHYRKVGTCYNIVLDIKHWLVYMKVHEKRQVSAAIEFYMRFLRNLMRKKRKDQKRRLSRGQLESDLKFPKGGKKELITIFDKKSSRVDNILQKISKDDQPVKEKDKIFAYYWIASHVFMHNPQARVGAITSMSVQDMKILRTDEYATSTNFKTSDTYGSQVILCHSITLHYIEAYLLLLRPWLNAKNKDSDPSDKLFLSLSGKPFPNVGVCVTRLFAMISKFHITTNGLRTIFETDITEAAMSNVISNEEKDFVARHNNHSSTCAWNHYQKCNSVKAALATKKTHDILYGEPSLPLKPLKLNRFDETFVPNLQEEMLEQHESSSARKRTRVDWSDEELMHLNNWANYHNKKHGIDTKKDWGKCVKALQKYECFHSSHLQNEKLREAYKRLQSNAK